MLLSEGEGAPQTGVQWWTPSFTRDTEKTQVSRRKVTCEKGPLCEATLKGAGVFGSQKLGPGEKCGAMTDSSGLLCGGGAN